MLGLALFVAFSAAPAEVPALPTRVEAGPRLDFVDEICGYDWIADRWGCDLERITRVPVERFTLLPGIAAIEVRPQRAAIGDNGLPTLLEPEERGQDPDNWGPKPTWACISGLEVEAPAGVKLSWGDARWTVNGDERPATHLEGSDAFPDVVQTTSPPCVGPRLLFQSDDRLEITLTLPYERDGEASTLRWTYLIAREGIDEKTAMAHVSPPRRWRGRVPEAPEPRTITRVIPVGSCLGAGATAMAVGAVALGQPQAGAPNPALLATAAYAAAAIPLLAGLAVDATLFAIWLTEGIQHFRYDVALGTLQHWDRSRNAYEARMGELGLTPPVDY